MNYFVLYVIIIILLLGWTFEKSSLLAYTIMGVYFILISFSYDTYDYLNYKRMYDEIVFVDTFGYEFIFEFLMKVGNYLGLTFEQFRMYLVVFEILLIHLTTKKIVGVNAFMWSMFIVYPGWILVPLLRFALSLSIMIFSIRFLIEEKPEDLATEKPKKKHFNRFVNSAFFIACVVIASFIHSSFWIMSLLVLVKFVDQKKILWSAIFLVIFAFITRDPKVISSLLSFLPIRLSAIDKVYDSSARSFNGLLFNTLKQCIILTFGYFAVTIYQMENKEIQEETIEKRFMKTVLPVNYVSTFFLLIAVFTSSSRLTFFPIVYNLIAFSICIKKTSGQFINKIGLKICALFFCLILSVIMCKMESKEIFDFILVMIFETNDVFNM